MNMVMKIFLSMSFSGSLLILALFTAKHFWKNKISRQWQYYIWLIVVLRLLLPFGLEINLMGKTYQAIDQAIIQNSLLPVQQAVPDASTPPPIEPGAVVPNTPTHPFRDIASLTFSRLWLIWLLGALILLIRKITVYQSFLQYINAGSTPVSNIDLLDRLSLIAEQMNVKKPVELCVNPLISSPLLTGFFRPCIVLPSAGISEKDFQYIALHELTHYKRRDMFYKWLVQVTICLHWFNPFVHLMGREITKACEFSCDEAILAGMGGGKAQEYGKTLLDAMASVGKYKESLGSITLSENKQLLKERLGAIMKFKKQSRTVKFLTSLLTLCVVLGASFIGVYPMENSVSASGIYRSVQTQSDYSDQAEEYYQSDSFPLFQLVFAHLDEGAQKNWLDRIYTHNQIAFWGAVVNLLDEDCDLVQHFAEKTYGDGNIIYFSILANHMSRELLEMYLDKSLKDGNWVFQSVLYGLLDRDSEFDELEEKKEKEWAEAQRAEYQAAGVTMIDEKNYYYQGQLVDIFLDQQANQSFYTLNMNPAGTVNIKILRDADNKITGVAYMSKAEIEELFGDMEDDDEEEAPAPKVIPVDLKSVTNGTVVWLGEYTLSEGDKIRYDISAETGNGIQIAFSKDARLNPVYYSVHNLRQKGEPLKCTADNIVGGSMKPGTYKLFIRATDGDLGNVKGSISLTLEEFY